MLQQKIYKDEKLKRMLLKLKKNDQIDSKLEIKAYGKDISSAEDKNSKEMRDIQTRKIDFGHLKNNELKADLEKILNQSTRV